MSERHEKLNQLQTRLEHLEKYEKAFKLEIEDIRREIFKLRFGPQEDESQHRKSPPPRTTREAAEERADPPVAKPQAASYAPPPAVESFKTDAPKENNYEKFVGTWLISVIGVLVTVIGVGIGAKYAIDNELISPLLRIVFGYTVGFGLVGASVFLKEKYEGFSSVLLSGGMAIMYFITYFAYDYYALISQTTAFFLMAIFTVFTVASALIYDRRIIAHIGLVGAYAVPFLLSEGSGRAEILFSYMAIVNIGILAVSVTKYWKYLFFSAFAFTWLIFAGWFVNNYYDQQIALAMSFLTVFFLIFHATFLVFKIIHKKALGTENVALILINSFAYFGFGYALIADSNWFAATGLFAVSNAVVHFVTAALIYKFKLGDRNAFYLSVALVATFLTIAVPIELDGNLVTVVWIAEAAFLFVAGRIRRIPLFEYFSYAAFSIACLSLLSGWQGLSYARAAGFAEALVPVFNGEFATSFFAACCLGLAFFVDRLKTHRSLANNNLALLFRYVLPTVFLIVLYNSFRVEIDTWFYSREILTAVQIKLPNIGDLNTELVDGSLRFLSGIWQLNYSLVFVTALGLLNLRRLKSAGLGIVTTALGTALIAVTLTFGLFFLGELRDIYISGSNEEFFNRGIYLILIRYITMACAAGVLTIVYNEIGLAYIKRFLPGAILKLLFDLGLAFTVLVLLSNELITWLSVFGTNDVYKLGISILWGLYSVSLIVLGIYTRKKHLRIFAISLFGVTLAKLFLYDMADLNTIPRTILFVSIGFMLLVASFLYNKYTKFIFEEEDKN